MQLQILQGVSAKAKSRMLSFIPIAGLFYSFTDLVIPLQLKRMCKEGAYWDIHFVEGTVAGVYVGVEYGMERARGTKDWKNAMLGGALTGLLISAVSNNNRDKVFKDAITAGAVATAAEFINYLT
ncbi:hypothetical protein ZIOFF_022114 [Zingiber officinale]|uniref:Uncharacterized protein n=1 Tax=Zingiber officinale TaxID=94328 RepID=A0A8J5H2L3_ZINOF|nr:hypothetical protein ZIOFF_022114 [Zingiber officinale]